MQVPSQDQRGVSEGGEPPPPWRECQEKSGTALDRKQLWFPAAPWPSPDKGLGREAEPSRRELAGARVRGGDVGGLCCLRVSVKGLGNRGIVNFHFLRIRKVKQQIRFCNKYLHAKKGRIPSMRICLIGSISVAKKKMKNKTKAPQIPYCRSFCYPMFLCHLSIEATPPFFEPVVTHSSVFLFIRLSI